MSEALLIASLGIVGSVVVGLLSFLGAYLYARPAIEKLNKEKKLLDANGAKTQAETAVLLSGEYKKLYEEMERIASEYESRDKKRDERIQTLERQNANLIDQYERIRARHDASQKDMQILRETTQEEIEKLRRQVELLNMSLSNTQKERDSYYTQLIEKKITPRRVF